MDADCTPSSELPSSTEYAGTMPHVEYTQHTASQQSLNYTHRTAHGQHGLGDKTTLQELADDTLAEIKRDFPNVFSEPTFPVDRPESQQHHIHLKDPSKDPPCKKLYMLDKVELEALKE